MRTLRCTLRAQFFAGGDGGVNERKRKEKVVLLLLLLCRHPRTENFLQTVDQINKSVSAIRNSLGSQFVFNIRAVRALIHGDNQLGSNGSRSQWSLRITSFIFGFSSKRVGFCFFFFLPSNRLLVCPTCHLMLLQ